jgi:hypothetical protein
MVQTAEGWGNAAEKASKIAYDAYGRFSHNELIEADNKAAQLQLLVQRDAKQLKGKDAIGVGEVYGKMWDDGVAEIESGIKTPGARDAFKRSAQSRFGSMSVSLDRYADEQYSDWEQGERVARIKNLTDVAESVSDTPELVALNKAEYDSAVADVAKENFQYDETKPINEQQQARDFFDQMNQSYITAIIASQVTRGNIPLARSYRDEAVKGGLISDKKAREIDNEIRGYQKRAQEDIYVNLVNSKEANPSLDVRKMEGYSALSPQQKRELQHPIVSDPSALSSVENLTRSVGQEKLGELSQYEFETNYASRLSKTDADAYRAAWKKASGVQKTNSKARATTPAAYNQTVETMIKQAVKGGKKPDSKKSRADFERVNKARNAMKQAFVDAQNSGKQISPSDYIAIAGSVVKDIKYGRGVFVGMEYAKQKPGYELTINDIDIIGTLHSLGYTKESGEAAYHAGKITEAMLVREYIRTHQ